MATIADKLRALRETGSRVVNYTLKPISNISRADFDAFRKALAEFPDPDAVGACVKAVTYLIEEIVRIQGLSHTYDDLTLSRMTFARTALAKLENK